MIDQINLREFESIYEETYNQISKYIVCHCSNLEDVNDIIQETYVELYRILLKGKIIENIESYLVGIAKNKIRKHYGLLYKFRTVSLNSKDDSNLEIIDKIPDITDIENITMKGIDIEIIWEQLKKKKMNIQRIFYLYYNMDFTIKEISNELHLGESYIKNCLYRTLKELQKFMRKDGN